MQVESKSKMFFLILPKRSLFSLGKDSKKLRVWFIFNVNLLFQNDDLLSCKSWLNGLRNFFHQPFGSGGCSTYSDRGSSGKQRTVYLFSAVYQVGIWVDFFAFAEQHFSVGTFLATHKEYQVVRSCKFPYVWNAIGYLSADGIIIFECDIRRDMFFDIFYDFLEFVQWLCCLRI